MASIKSQGFSACYVNIHDMLSNIMLTFARPNKHLRLNKNIPGLRKESVFKNTSLICSDIGVNFDQWLDMLVIKNL